MLAGVALFTPLKFEIYDSGILNVHEAEQLGTSQNELRVRTRRPDADVAASIDQKVGSIVGLILDGQTISNLANEPLVVPRPSQVDAKTAVLQQV